MTSKHTKNTSSLSLEQSSTGSSRNINQPFNLPQYSFILHKLSKYNSDTRTYDQIILLFPTNNTSKIYEYDEKSQEYKFNNTKLYTYPNKNLIPHTKILKYSNMSREEAFIIFGGKSINNKELYVLNIHILSKSTDIEGHT